MAVMTLPARSHAGGSTTTPSNLRAASICSASVGRSRTNSLSRSSVGGGRTYFRDTVHNRSPNSCARDSCDGLPITAALSHPSPQYQQVQHRAGGFTAIHVNMVAHRRVGDRLSGMIYAHFPSGDRHRKRKNVSPLQDVITKTFLTGDQVQDSATVRGRSRGNIYTRGTRAELEISTSHESSDSEDSRPKATVPLRTLIQIFNPKTLLEPSELKEIWALGLPAFGVILSDPLMSLIDTACVGQAGSVSLAAMGPTTAVFNFVFQLFTFLSIATTGLVARAAARRGSKGRRSRQIKRLTSDALFMAVAMGIVMSALLQVFAVPILQLLGTPSDILLEALPYLRIRGLAVPAVLIGMVTQGACIGLQDSRTPLAIILAAGLVNGVLDIYLVLPRFGHSLGLTGAAIATLIAQTVAAFAFLLHLKLKGHLPTVGTYKLPGLRRLLPFTRVSGMLLAGNVARMGVYTVITVAATRGGVATIAAHQIALQVFWFLTYFVDPLFVTATSFITRDIKRNAHRSLRMAILLLALSMTAGAGLGLVAFLIPFIIGDLFTTDPAINALFRHVAPMMGIGQMLASVTLVAEGILIGAGDVGYLARIHVVNFVVLAGYVYMVVHLNLGIRGIWFAIVLNQLMRLTEHVFRVASGKTRFPVHDLFSNLAKESPTPVGIEPEGGWIDYTMPTPRPTLGFYRGGEVFIWQGEGI